MFITTTPGALGCISQLQGSLSFRQQQVSANKGEILKTSS